MKESTKDILYPAFVIFGIILFFVGFVFSIALIASIPQRHAYNRVTGSNMGYWDYVLTSPQVVYYMPENIK